MTLRSKFPLYSTTSPTHPDTTTDDPTLTIISSLSLQTLPSVSSLSSSDPIPTSTTHLCLSSFKPQPSPITALAISNNLLYAASGNQINVFDLAHHTHLDAFNDNTDSGSVKSLVFSNGKLFTAHQDCKVRVWQLTQLKRHQLIATLPTVKDRLRRFVLPKNYVSIRRHKKRLWIEHVDAVSGLAVNNDLIYSVSWDKCLKIWRSKDMLCVESVKVHEDAVNAVVVSVDGTVYTGSADRRIRVWGKTVEKRHSLLATLEKHKSAVNALALSRDGSVLFSGACDRSILVWEKEDTANHMAVSGALRGHKGSILCLVSISVNESDLLFSGSADRTVRIWQRCVETKRYCCLSVMEGHEKPVKSLVAISDADSRNTILQNTVTVCSGSLDGEIKMWRVEVSNNHKSLSPTLR